jgi:(p)ppGpp synthase/HD superfamily hydrolase
MFFDIGGRSPEALANSTLYRAALALAEDAYSGVVRTSGETYLAHAEGVAHQLAAWSAPDEVVAAGLLHGALKEDFARPEFKAQILSRAGERVAHLVDEVAQMDALRKRYTPETVGDRDLADDRFVRSVPWVATRFERTPDAAVVEIADRLENFRTVGVLDRDEQIRFARVALFVIAPFADRFGMRGAARELQNNAFRILDPAAYAEELAERTASRCDDSSREMAAQLESELGRNGLRVNCLSRPGSVRSSHLTSKGTQPGQRPGHPVVVVTPSRSSCYEALGIIHDRWPPTEHGLRDYIANPKPNGYRSLHTRVRLGHNLMDVLIRSETMETVAELGYCAQWLGVTEYRPSHFRWVEPKENQVAVLTPQGMPQILPKGATALDFAFKVHADLGIRCLEAWVFDHQVDFNHPLSTGDVVTIIESPYAVPTAEWLDWVATPTARSKLRRALQAQENAAAIASGRTRVEIRLRREGLDPTRIDMAHVFAGVARDFDFATPDTMLAYLGRGETKSGAMLSAIQSKFTFGNSSPKAVATDPGRRHLPTPLAKCCRPVPPQPIAGFPMKRGKMIRVHRTDCGQLARQDSTVEVVWQSARVQLGAAIDIVAGDRLGLLRDVADTAFMAGVSITTAQMIQLPDGEAQISLSLAEDDLATIERIRVRAQRINGVKSVLFRARNVRAPGGAITAPNPFSLYPVFGGAFYGRTEELRTLAALISNRRTGTVLLHGPRRVGKSSILEHCQQTDVFGEAYLPIKVDLQGVPNLFAMAHQIEKGCAAAFPDVPPEKWRQADSPHAHVARLRHYLQAIMSHTDRRVVLMLDEFQSLGLLEDGPASVAPLMEYLRGETVGRRSMRLIVTASGPKRLLHMQLHNSGLDASVDLCLSFLPPNDAREAILSPLSEIVFDEEVVERIIELSSLHPYFLNLLAMDTHFWASRNGVGEVRSTDFEGVLDSVVSDTLESHFGHVWGEGTGLTPTEIARNRLLLSVVSSVEDCPRKGLSDALASALSEDEINDGLEDLDEMMAIGTNATSGGLFVRVELVRRWLFTHYPARRAIREYRKTLPQ